MKNDFQTFLRSRRSVRSFKDDPVPPEIIWRILETAIHAPSAHNLQPWRFVVLTSIEHKIHLAEEISDKFRKDMTIDGVPDAEIQMRVERTIRRSKEAPVVIILCRDTTEIKPENNETRRQAEKIMSIQSVALAGLQLLLAAHSEGLGATWICWPLFAPDETRLALSLAPEWEPEGMVFLGYPAETPEMPTRIEIEKVVKYL